MAWHVYVNRLYSSNHTAWIPAYKINLVLLAWPPAWPQLFAAGGYTILPIVLYRKRVKDATLRLWLWTLPAWFGLMFLYGIIVESRLYGELIPYLACMGALIAEQSILARIGIDAQPSEPARMPSQNNHAQNNRAAFSSRIGGTGNIQKTCRWLKTSSCVPP